MLLYHCGDGAAFLGAAGRRELEPYPDAIDDLQQSEEYLASLDKERGPTAYLFRCRHCGRHLAYSDFA